MKPLAAFALLILLAACTATTDPQFNPHVSGLYSTGVAGFGR